jgi:Ca2+-binding RTX toxin-like protein
VTQLTIPGATGNTVTFTVTGSSTTNYAQSFSAAVANATVITQLSPGTSPSTVRGALNIIQASSSTPYTLTTPGQYTYAAVTSPTQINGSSGLDTVVAGGDVYYVASGGHNNVDFTNGENIYFGANEGGNTISGGSGNDTINTGLGNDTVFSGTGDGLVNLTDQYGSDIVALLAGNTNVNAYGYDTVYASAALNASTTGTIFGSTGALTFVAGSSDSTLAVTIVGGSGYTTMFGGAGSDIVFANSAGAAIFVAGAGNETLNGFNAAGGYAFFGDTTPADAASINDTIIGGTGPDYFATGGGHEYISAGPGAALFDINDLGQGTDITVANFGAADFVTFAGLTRAAETSLLQTASVVSNGNLTITLQNGTQVEFLSTTSLTGHLT